MGYEYGKKMYILDSYYSGSSEYAVTFNTFRFNDLKYENIDGECDFGVSIFSGGISNRGSDGGKTGGEFDWEIPK